MTESLVVVFRDANIDLSSIADWLRPIGVVVSEQRVVTVVEHNAKVHIVAVDDVERDGVFEDWPQSLIPDTPGAVFSLDYRVPELAVRVVHRLASHSYCLLDTNYGSVVEGRELRPEDLNIE